MLDAFVKTDSVVQEFQPCAGNSGSLRHWHLWLGISKSLIMSEYTWRLDDCCCD